MNSEELQKDRELPQDNLIDNPEVPDEEDLDEGTDNTVEEESEDREEAEAAEVSEEEIVPETYIQEEEPEDTKEPLKKREKKGNFIFSLLIAVFCLIIFGVGAANIIAPDRDFSESENRVLSKMPKFTFFSLAEGTFTDDFETYLTDQFIFRDEIIAAKTFLERVTGKKEAGGVYIGKDGYLFSEQTPFNEKAVTETTDAISAFADKYKESRITFMLSPNSSYVNSDKLPESLFLHDQNMLIQDIESYTLSESISWLNLSEAFKEYEDRDSLFYKTDHHWTTRAAHLAFTKLMAQWEKDISNTKFKFMSVADDFQGTLSSKAGVLSSCDTVEICVPEKSELSYIVTIDDAEEKKATLFDESKLSSKNKYEVFLGGNYGEVIIDTASESNDSLLIIKDSYANCMVPMFTPFFGKIVIVDPRYFKESLAETVEENGFTHILFLYNLNTLLEDREVAECLGK